MLPEPRSLDLEPIDDGSFYRLSSQELRRHVVQHGESLKVQVEVVDIIHGTLSLHDSRPATLVVTDFRFLASKKSTRIQSVFINYRFGHPQDSKSNPVIIGISPTGTESYSISTKTGSSNFASSTSGVLGSAGSNATLWAPKEEGDATLAGDINVEGRDYGEPDTVTWALMEGDVKKMGTPNLLRTAILLQHDEAYEPFTATIKIDATVDLAYEIKRLSSRLEDNPIPFKIDRNISFDNNLQAINLSDRSAVATVNTVESVARGGAATSGSDSGRQSHEGSHWAADSNIGNVTAGMAFSDSQPSENSRGKAPKLRDLTSCANHMLQLLKRILSQKEVTEQGDENTL